MLFVKKQMAIAALTPATILAAFSLLSLYDPSIRGSVWEMSCICAGIFMIPVFFSLVVILRFRRMIQNQERKLDVMFQDAHACALANDPLVFLSDDWLICAGSMAFHRDYIRYVFWERDFPRRAGSGYRMRIQTIDHKTYRFYLQSVLSCRKIHDWWHRKGESDLLEEISELWDIGVF